MQVSDGVGIVYCVFTWIKEILPRAYHKSSSVSRASASMMLTQKRLRRDIPTARSLIRSTGLTTKKTAASVHASFQSNHPLTFLFPHPPPRTKNLNHNKVIINSQPRHHLRHALVAASPSLQRAGRVLTSHYRLKPVPACHGSATYASDRAKAQITHLSILAFGAHRQGGCFLWTNKARACGGVKLFSHSYIHTFGVHRSATTTRTWSLLS